MNQQTRQSGKDRKPLTTVSSRKTKGHEMLSLTQRKTMASCSLATALLLLTGSMTLAGEAATSASAGSNGVGPGTASATAAYTGGGRGQARTNTRSGRNVSFGQGIAYGVDRNGISFSASNAVATRFGPAFASTFNITIGRGGVAASFGTSTAGGSRNRTANAGGFAGNRFGRPTAGATAGGRTGRRGWVRANTRSFSRRSRLWRR